MQDWNKSAYQLACEKLVKVGVLKPEVLDEFAKTRAPSRSGRKTPRDREHYRKQSEQRRIDIAAGKSAPNSPHDSR